MRILFLCGSLEHGRDGVGDYIRRLADELTSEGHIVAASAMYDSYVEAFAENVENFNKGIFEIIRIPVSCSSKARFNHVSNLVKKFNPDWISLQYVGFGFHRYGLPWDITFFFRNAIGNIKLHVMLHELWCGMPEEAGSKEKLLGSSQRVFLKLMLSVIKPDSVSTSNSFYSSELKRIHIKSNVVPIFGNIPLGDWGPDYEWKELMANAGLFELTAAPHDWLVLGFFGAIYVCPGLDDLLKCASGAATQAGLKLGLLAFGNNGQQDIKIIAKDIEGCTTWKTGVLTIAMINRLIRLVDAGVATTPADRLNKSGSATAFLERSVPILISASDKTYNKATMKVEGIYQANEPANVLRAGAAKGKIPPRSTLGEVVKFYISLGKDKQVMN